MMFLEYNWRVDKTNSSVMGQGGQLLPNSPTAWKNVYPKKQIVTASKVTSFPQTLD
jgi:hypothetical protein